MCCGEMLGRVVDVKFCWPIMLRRAAMGLVTGKLCFNVFSCAGDLRIERRPLLRSKLNATLLDVDQNVGKVWQWCAFPSLKKQHAYEGVKQLADVTQPLGCYQDLPGSPACVKEIDNVKCDE